MTPAAAPGDYSRTLCDERHDRLDGGLSDLARRLDALMERVGTVRDEVVTLRTQEDARAREAERSRGLFLKILPWLIAAFLGGGGGATLIRSAIQEPPAPTAVMEVP